MTISLELHERPASSSITAEIPITYWTHPAVQPEIYYILEAFKLSLERIYIAAITQCTRINYGRENEFTHEYEESNAN